MNYIKTKDNKIFSDNRFYISCLWCRGSNKVAYYKNSKRPIRSEGKFKLATRYYYCPKCLK